MEKTDVDAVVATVWPFGWARTALSEGAVVEVTLHEGRPETEQLSAMDAWWDEGVGAGHGDNALLDVARRTARWWEAPPPALAPWGSAFQRAVWTAVGWPPRWGVPRPCAPWPVRSPPTGPRCGFLATAWGLRVGTWAVSVGGLG